MMGAHLEWLLKIRLANDNTQSIDQHENNGSTGNNQMPVPILFFLMLFCIFIH